MLLITSSKNATPVCPLSLNTVLIEKSAAFLLSLNLNPCQTSTDSLNVEEELAILKILVKDSTVCPDNILPYSISIVLFFFKVPWTVSLGYWQGCIHHPNSSYRSKFRFIPHSIFQAIVDSVYLLSDSSFLNLYTLNLYMDKNILVKAKCCYLKVIYFLSFPNCFTFSNKSSV